MKVRAFWIIIVLEAVLFSILNWHAQAMTGLLPYYDDFARIIRGGFDPSLSVRGTPAFPMWGYGWIVLLLRSKAVIVVFQQLLAMVAVWFAFQSLQRNGLEAKRKSLLLGVLLIASPTWFAHHSVLWPNSIAVSLFVISAALMVMGQSKDSVKLMTASGLIFGLLLNFRSDVVLFPIAAAVVAILTSEGRQRAVRLVAPYLAGAYLMLLPWALYTHRATGHYLTNSTNGGHFFFVGLGNLPGNKWGIVPDDGDPVMHGLLKQQFGSPTPPSVSYQADVFLKKEFSKRVKEDPGEYARKIVYTTKSMLTKGAYPTEFYESPGCKPNCAERIQFSQRGVSGHLSYLGTLPKTEAVGSLLSIAADIGARLFVALGYLLLPFTAWLAIRKRRLLAGLVVLAILYQSALSALGHYMQAYTSNVYLFFLLNIALGTSVIWGSRAVQRLKIR